MTAQRYRYNQGGTANVSWFEPGQQPAGAVAVPADYDTVRYRFDDAAKAYVLDLAGIEADLIAQVKLISERLSMRVLSPGGSKKMKYASKAAEVEAWYALGAVGAVVSVLLTALNLLPASVRQRRFRYALADAAKRGEANIADAIARFEAGVNAAQGEAARLEAVEQDAVARIKAAGTAAAKQAAYDATSWGVTQAAMSAAMKDAMF